MKTIKKIYTIEDEFHAEEQGEYSTYEDALEELKKRKRIPWNQKPNKCPCSSWQTCGRKYEIIEYETNTKPWTKISQKPVLEVSAREVKWF